MSASLSICIPTFNRAGFLEACLAAFVPQVQPHAIPICVSDNGSSDNTREVIERFQKIYPLLTYRANPTNLGIDQNIVDAVAMANTPYAWLFGDDDLPVADAIERLLPYLTRDFKLIVVNASTYNDDLTRLVEERRVMIDDDQVYPPGDHNRLMRDTASYITYLGGLVVDVASWRSVDPTPFLRTDYVHVSVVFRYIVGRTAALCASPLIKLRLQRPTWFSRYFEVEMVNWPHAVWGTPPQHYSAAAKQSVCHEQPTASPRRIMAMRAYGQYNRATYDQYIASDVRIPSSRKLLFRAIAAIPRSWLNHAFVAFIKMQQLRKPGSYSLALFRLREASKW